MLIDVPIISTGCNGTYNQNIDKCLAHNMVWLCKTKCLHDLTAVLLQITIENIGNLFVQVCNLAIFEADDVKKRTRRNIVPVIDRGVFHNYVHMCKQLFLCDVIRSRCSKSTPLSRLSHLFIME